MKSFSLLACVVLLVIQLRAEITPREMAGMEWSPVSAWKPVTAKVGHGNLVAGKLERAGEPLKISRSAVRDGLHAHAPSQLVYDIKGLGYKVFRGKVGVLDGYSLAKVQFAVLGDGKELWKSKVIHVEKKGKTPEVEGFAIDISTVGKLELVVDDLGDRSDDNSVWIKPELGK